MCEKPTDFSVTVLPKKLTATFILGKIFWLLIGQATNLYLYFVQAILFNFLIFTGRNEVVAKVIFLHLSVILFTGGSASVHAGILPWQQTPPLRSRHPLPGAETPRSRHPPGIRYPLGSRLQHTVYEQPVRILLQCILVFQIICLKDGAQHPPQWRILDQLLLFRASFMFARYYRSATVNSKSFISKYFLRSKWIFKLNVFDLTVHFKHEMIGIWQRCNTNFKLSWTLN